nr:YheC/YheD family protein [Tumebacillus amylolyticus]
MSGSKWNKYRLIQGVPALADIQPETRLYSTSNLTAMLRRFKTLYVKPDDSFGGLDVLCLTKSKQGKGIQMQHGRLKKSFASIAEFHNWFQTLRRRRRFIIQQGIGLAPWHGRPVDIRTLVQRNEKGLWETTGYFAKAGAPGLAITNIKSGGKLLTVRTYLRSLDLSLDERAAILRELQLMSEQVAQVFGPSFSNRRYGLDIGIDRKHKLWLIEVNTRTSINVLHKVDKEMYRRAAKLAKKKL